MKNKVNTKMLKAAFAGLILFVSGFANAGVITIGGLTLENVGDNYVTDHVNNVDYLRWDLVKNFKYNELLTALQPGNTYFGWKIASNGEANDFVNALLDGSSSCDSIVENLFQFCTFPFSYTNFAELMGGFEDEDAPLNAAFFLSDNGMLDEVGAVIVSGYRDGYVGKYNEFDSIANSDSFSPGGSESDTPYGFLLYRDAAEVHEPSTLAILALAMIGLASRRFKKQS
jgi:hypothetical protein